MLLHLWTLKSEYETFTRKLYLTATVVFLAGWIKYNIQTHDCMEVFYTYPTARRKASWGFLAFSFLKWTKQVKKNKDPPQQDVRASVKKRVCEVKAYVKCFYHKTLLLHITRSRWDQIACVKSRCVSDCRESVFALCGRSLTSLAFCTASLGGFLICGEDLVLILS